MRHVVGIAVLLVLGGCVKESPPIQEPLVQACPLPEEKPPKIVEVPVPVPMPCQLKPVQEFLPVSTPAKKGRMRVKAGSDALQLREGPTSEQWVNSVQVYQYMPNALYQVYAAKGMATSLLLQPGEKFTGSGYVCGGCRGTGDQKEEPPWSLGTISSGSAEGLRSGIAMSCAIPGDKTNLTITTDRRLYLVELHCTESTYMASVSWEYPGGGGSMVLGNAIVDTVSSSVSTPPVAVPLPVTSPDQLDFNYVVKQTHGKATPAWLPIRVFNDGRKVYLKFPAALLVSDAPVLFVRTPEGTQAITNWRVRSNDTYEIDGLPQEMELRVGEKSPIVVKITHGKGL